MDNARDLGRPGVDEDVLRHQVSVTEPHVIIVLGLGVNSPHCRLVVPEGFQGLAKAEVGVEVGDGGEGAPTLGPRAVPKAWGPDSRAAEVWCWRGEGAELGEVAGELTDDGGHLGWRHFAEGGAEVGS